MPTCSGASRCSRCVGRPFSSRAAGVNPLHGLVRGAWLLARPAGARARARPGVPDRLRVALDQFPALLGERGLLPVPRYLARRAFRDSPSLFHCATPTGCSRLRRLERRRSSPLAWCSAFPHAGPLWAPMLVWLLLWALYLSIVNVGQTFYRFGWETLLLEAGFLAVFLGRRDAPRRSLILWLLRWLLFRVEFGAGLIKMRGDRCWRDLTCLYYHHETQPMPNPLSWYFHHLPKPLHRVEVARQPRRAARRAVRCSSCRSRSRASRPSSMVVTQAWLMLSGNFSWLNLLTIVLAASRGRRRPRATSAAGRAARPLARPGLVSWLVLARDRAGRRCSATGRCATCSRRRQLMNASFNPLHLVNTYGAFGSVTRRRYEVVIEGTDDAERHRRRRRGASTSSRASRAIRDAGRRAVRAVPPAARLAHVVRGARARLRRPVVPAAPACACWRATGPRSACCATIRSPAPRRGGSGRGSTATGSRPRSSGAPPARGGSASWKGRWSARRDFGTRRPPWTPARYLTKVKG